MDYRTWFRCDFKPLKVEAKIQSQSPIQCFSAIQSSELMEFGLFCTFPHCQMLLRVLPGSSGSLTAGLLWSDSSQSIRNSLSLQFIPFSKGNTWKQDPVQCRVTRLRINVPVWSWETAMMYAAAVAGWGNQWLLNQSDTVALERNWGGTGTSWLWASLPPQGDFSQELLCPDILAAFFQFWKRPLNYAQSSPYWATPPLSPTHHKKEEQKFLFLCEKPWAWCGLSSSCALAVCRPYSGTDSALGPYVHWNRWSGRCWSKLSYVI